MSIRFELLISSVIASLCLIGVGLTGWFFIHRVAAMFVTGDEQSVAIHHLSRAEENAWKVLVRIYAHIGSGGEWYNLN